MDRADELWNAAPELGVTPDLISFSSLVKGYCVLGNLEQALAVFGQLRRRGLRPDAKCFQTLLKGCLRLQALEEAVAVAEDAAACGVALDAGLLQDLVFVLERRAPDLARRFGPKLAGAPRGTADARRPAPAAG